MNTGNSKTDESRKFVFNVSQRSDLRSLSKHVALKNLSIYYTEKVSRNNIKSHSSNIE